MSVSDLRTRAVRIREVKREIRVLGIDDGVFYPRSGELVHVVGVVFRGGYWLDGFMHTKVQVDGTDATQKLTSMITTSPHFPQLRVVMLNGVTLAGFNVVDIQELHVKVGLPIIAITRRKPSFKDIKNGLRNLPESEKRWEAIEKAGKLITVHTREEEGPIYAHATGITEETAKRVVKITATRSSIPEALRVAHIIASGFGHE